MRSVQLKIHWIYGAIKFLLRLIHHSIINLWNVQGAKKESERNPFFSNAHKLYFFILYAHYQVNIHIENIVSEKLLAASSKKWEIKPEHELSVAILSTGQRTLLNSNRKSK